MPMRREKMIQYWNRINEIAIKANLNKDEMKEIVRKTYVTFRDNTNEFFQILDKNEIPLSIISAGIGNVIMEMFTQKSKIYSNMKIVANFIEYDEKDLSCKFTGETIHMFNKNDAISFDKDYFKTIKNRTNIILLGDSEGDELIADGLPNAKNILKIGFLNKIDETKLEKYKNIFDIVLINDLTFDTPNQILKYILKI
jgi:HAD superfamily hydrolase (TIGR01544 family)